jgi:hypothetical protein
MEVALVLAVVIVGAIVVLLTVPYLRYRRDSRRMSLDFDEYRGLRRQYLADPTLAADQAFGQMADASVARLGPRFDPRLSAWTRLGSAQPRLLAYVSQYVDPSVEEPLDLDAFADSILLITLVPPDVVGPGFWQKAMKSCFELAAEWRMAQPGRYREAVSPATDRAVEEAEAVTRRLYRSGDWRWDFEDDIVVEQHGRMPAVHTLTPSTGSAAEEVAERAVLAPEIGPESPSASHGPGDGPYQTRADRALQLDTYAHLTFQVGFLSGQRSMPDCGDAYVASIEQSDVSAQPGDALLAELSSGPGTWLERWTLDCGGTRLRFVVTFMPDPNGGTNLNATLME